MSMPKSPGRAMPTIRRRRLEEEEEKSREEARKRAAETVIGQPAVPPPPSQPAAPVAKGGGGDFADNLLADLDSFNQREEEERKAKEEHERKKREERERQERELAERKAREEQERARKEAEERRRREEEERRAREEEERRKEEEEERLRAMAEERKRRAKEAMAAKQAESAAPASAGAADDDIGVSEEDLDLDDVKRDEAMVSAEAKRRRKEREQEKEEAARAAEEMAHAKPARKPVKWGKPVALTLFGLLVVAIGAIHVMPVSVGEYEKAASDALGQPVKIGSGRVSVITGPRVSFSNVTVGGARLANVRGTPSVGSLFGARKSFSRIEIDGPVIPQQAIGEALFAKLKGDNFTVERVVVKQAKFDGPLALPALDADATIGSDGAVRSISVSGPDGLAGRITPKDSDAEFEVNANGFVVPFAPDIKFSQFGMKGTANRQGMNIAEWGGSALTGTLSGTASIRWGGTWTVEGVITARGINAGVFAPTLVSEGRGEGTGKFSMSGEPKELASSGRVEGNFTINKGVLSSFDLSRAIQTGGRQPQGRTPFSEMTGQATYEKGAVALRNVTVGAGALNAGISLDIAENGALSGRVVADVKTPTQSLRATFSLAGTVKEPQVR
jgi:actin-related protein